MSVYTAPGVKPGKFFMYFDPLHSLSESIQQDWFDEDKSAQMVEAARFAAMGS